MKIGICKSCGTEFESSRYGQRIFCTKECGKKHYRATHKDEAKEYNKNYVAPPAVEAKKKKWRDDNAEYLKLKHQEYYQAHKEQIIERSAVFAENNREKVRGYNRKYQKTEHGYDKVFNNVRRRLARKRNAEGSHTRSQFRALCAKYDHQCLCCGVKAKLEADHIIPLVCGGSDDISNIQPLCRNCNAQKATETADYRPIMTMVAFSEFADVQWNFPLPSHSAVNMQEITR